MWTKQLTELLIAKYREHDILYDARNPLYSSKKERYKSLLEIRRELNKIDRNVTVEYIKKKIHTLRAQYIKERWEIDKCNGGEDVYKPTLWCYPQLTFLKPYITRRKLDTNISQVSKGQVSFVKDSRNNADDAHSEDSDSSLSTDLQSHKTKRKFNWKRENLKLFIKMYKKYSILYDSNHKDYSNRQLRFNAYCKLLKETKTLDPKISLEDVRDKIRCLRKEYNNELYCIQTAKENNVSYTPKLWYFGRLNNLYKDKFDIKSFSKLNNEEETDDDDNFNSTQLSDVTIINDHANNNKLLEFEEIQQAVDENTMEYDEEPITLPNMDMTQNNKHDKKPINNIENVKFEWLSDLVVSQMEVISPKYHTELAWDVQCLVRKYISKTKRNEETPASMSSPRKSCSNNQGNISTPQDFLLPRPSNISFNISFV